MAYGHYREGGDKMWGRGRRQEEKERQKKETERNKEKGEMIGTPTS